MNIFVSACLMGIRCRYDGSASFYGLLEEIKDVVNLIPVCPEVYGGMPTPRLPGERQGCRVIDSSGEDVTYRYTKGARDLAELAAKLGIRAAILKSRSPSCGHGIIYDGTFSSTKIRGNGVFAEALAAMGIELFDESESDKIKTFVGE